MADEVAQTATSGTVEDLKAHLDTVTSQDELDAIKQAETDGKNRTTAHDAIEAKRAELSAGAGGQEPDASPAGSDGQDANVTAPDGDKSADATHDEGGELTTTLAQTPHPEALTDADIDSISGGGLADDVSGPRSEVAEQLVINRDVANGEPHPYEDRVTFRAGPGAEIG